jgi:predicted TIM-barrel fold metal-dependent hydrolase
VGSSRVLDLVRKYRIIDSHGHLGYYKLFNIPDNSAKGMLKSMDKVGIEKVCVSALIGLEGDYKLGNDMVGEAIRISNGRIMGHACINPFEKADIIPELERCFNELNMSAIKLHPGLNDCPADSKNYYPVYEFAHEKKLVVMNHAWGNAKNLSFLAKKYYNIKLIQAHFGSAWDGNEEREILKSAKDLENVWIDTAGSGCYVHAFEKTVDYLGAEKIVFGTDFPFLDPCHQIGNVVFSDISDEDKNKILSLNFLKLIEN